MQIVKSIVTTDAILKSSNIPENEHAQWVSSASYVSGERVIYEHYIYEVIITHSGVSVPPNVDVVNWMKIGATNRWRMFDSVVSNESTNQSSIEFTLAPSQEINSLVFMNVSGAYVNVKIDDPLLGTVYDKTVELLGGSAISSYYDFFFAPLVDRKYIAVFDDIPPSPTSDIIITIYAGDAVASVSEVVYGNKKVIGRTKYGTQFGIKSFSRKEYDEFGNINVVKRKNSKFAEYDIDIDNYMLSDVQKFFADIDSVPCVFIGNPNMDELVVYGFYNEFSATISFPTVSTCTLRVEGLT